MIPLQIRLVLLPDRKQKNKTKVRPGEDPSFMETFVFNKINPGKLFDHGLIEFYIAQA